FVSPFSGSRGGFFFARGNPMATLRLLLIFPPDLVREPLIYTVSKTYRLVPNIRKARVTEASGEATLDFTGAEDDLKRGIEHLTRLGVKVRPIGTPRATA
ncbi:MAG: NIL domain-containing protein, partial [candidate division NC10 bacterium]